ncbi:uncharacterized protein LOC118485443 [Helianthus annuus]|uniref:uncharacterized protein LOC118485443 n=1 Tax=Helianthus annuus TaxID=4232 RepID=UPI001652FA14|nr:uncharacterized protein LOC118485443 [Helianthus annuus]
MGRSRQQFPARHPLPSDLRYSDHHSPHTPVTEKYGERKMRRWRRRRWSFSPTHFRMMLMMMVVTTAAVSPPSTTVGAGGSGGGCFQLGFGYRAPDSLAQILVTFKRVSSVSRVSFQVLCNPVRVLGQS